MLFNFVVVFAALVFYQPIRCAVNNTQENAARQLLTKMNAVYWVKAPTYRRFGDNILSPKILMREELRSFYAEMNEYNWRNFSDPSLRRQFEVILRGAQYPPLNAKLKQAMHKLMEMGRTKWSCPMSKDNTNCNLAFVPQIKSVLANSDSLDEIEYYWAEWRNKMPSTHKEALLHYIEYYQNLSTPNVRSSAIWFDQYETPDFIDELGVLMNNIKPFYQTLHAHLRHLLRLKYGAAIVDEQTGLIPHHLMEKVFYQSWKKTTVLQNPFPDRKLPNMQFQLDEQKYTAFDLVNASVEYYGTLGFQNISDDFMREHFLPMAPGNGGPDCKSRIFDFGEIEWEYCPKVTYKKLLQTHGDMTRIQYAIQKNQLPVGLNKEACPGFGNALGEAVILSVSSPKHLQGRLGLLKDYVYDDILNLNRLHRLAVHTLLSLPTYYVHEKLWIEMIDGTIEAKDYNCRYWTLMQEYMGVKPPVKTVSGAYDMPYKFYEGIIDQHRSTKKVFGELLGYQIYRAICLNIGEFVRGNAYKELNNCDFAHNRHAGTFIRNMMASGSTKPWREIIKPLTIRNLTQISSTAFLEYFEPLNQWLHDDNVSKNLSPGWQAINYCEAEQEA